MASGQVWRPRRPTPGCGHVPSFTAVFVFQPSAELNKANIRILPVFQVNAYLGAPLSFAQSHKGSEEDRLTSEYWLPHFRAGGACTRSFIALGLGFPFCEVGIIRNRSTRGAWRWGAAFRGRGSQPRTRAESPEAKRSRRGNGLWENASNTRTP